MPPKIKYSKEQIVDKAFEIAETEGLGSITIRKVAEKLNSSIAPIYVNFKNVEELIQEVIKKVFVISKNLLNEQNSGKPFQDIGLASLRFAREYPLIFRDLILNQKEYLQNYDQEMEKPLIEQMKQDEDLEGFTEAELRNILLKIRICQTGLYIMVSNGSLVDLSEEKTRWILESTAEDIISSARLRKQRKI